MYKPYLTWIQLKVNQFPSSDLVQWETHKGAESHTVGLLENSKEVSPSKRCAYHYQTPLCILW